MLTTCQLTHEFFKTFEVICFNTSISTARHHMQKEEIEQEDDAATHASKPYDKSMNDKRNDAQHMAEQLVAEETRAAPRSVLSAYMIAVIIGLIFWLVIYFIWRSL
jgi:hypothetical protein